MAYTLVTAVGENMDSLFMGLKEFETGKVILLVPPGKDELAEKAKQEVEKFRVPVSLKKIKGDLWEGTFQTLKEIKESEGDKNIIINTSAGDMNRCALCSGAFVNGLKAFTVYGNEIMLMPIMKFSYYKMLTDKKMDIVRYLYSHQECCASLEELSEQLGISLPLVSYHINGNLKSEGLKEMGLVMTEEYKGRVSVKLTLMGKLLVKGYVS